MDSRLLNVLEEAFGDDVALAEGLDELEAAIPAKLQTLGRGESGTKFGTEGQ